MWWHNLEPKTQRLARTIIYGQILSLLITGTGVCTQYLTTDYNLAIPSAQSVANYLLLALYGWGSTYHSLRKEDQQREREKQQRKQQRQRQRDHDEQRGEYDTQCLTNPAAMSMSSDVSTPRQSTYLQMGKTRVAWWWYLLLAIADVEGNYLVVKAYQYTSITSVMLLDCFTIPVVMGLSYFFLGYRYTRWHAAGVVLCVSGLVILVISDAERSEASKDLPVSNMIIGDVLCLVGATLYGISNVGQEAIVKGDCEKEWFRMLGTFGFIICFCQLLILENQELSEMHLQLGSGLFLGGFVMCLFLLYVLTPKLLIISDAAVLNLSLLTSDVWAVLFGLFLFGDQLSWLYFLAFAIIIGGVTLYNQRSPIVTNYVELPDDAHAAAPRGVNSPLPHVTMETQSTSSMPTSPMR
eukprot:GFYU01003044.1.p1 GENE.GFYU01003044.1~~GFYU01003044.1.p1  ORF type:complete len:410 (+),score=59.27 GFYU01003044.1:161-1390(+)